MKQQMIAALLVLIASASSAYAEIVKGTVLAFDRKANIIVLTDKSVYHFEGQQAQIPEGLKAGDKVEIDSDGGGDDGYGDIKALKIVQ